MALSGLEIYKLLPKTNCRDCGFPTCLAFALALAKKSIELDKCPHVSQEAKNTLSAQAMPPVKLITLGEGDNQVRVGNETVMFRHEEKFHNPCAMGFILSDSLSNEEIKRSIEKISAMQFERIGQSLKPELIAIRQAKDSNRFVEAVKLVAGSSNLAMVLVSQDADALKKALSFLKGKRALIHKASKDNLAEFVGLAKEHNASLSVSAGSLDELSELTRKANEMGFSDIVIDVDKKAGPSERLWELTHIRRQALKKSNRAFGYPMLTIISGLSPYEEVIEAGDCLAKYSSIILLSNIESWAALALLTLRQNIYTDPQKPLQIEPKVYSIGNTDENSPVIVTTNFSLTYYTVLGEVEASKVPLHIISVDTEGMSVLTAWAAEKFTADSISDAIKKCGIEEKVLHRNLIIPGYVAVMSGDLEDKSGWKIIVGPKEAAGLPAFLKNIS